MQHLLDNVYEHNGVKYELIENKDRGRTNPDCFYCAFKNSDACQFYWARCKAFHYYKQIKEVKK